MPVFTAAPLPLLYGWRITFAPAASARVPVSSLDPSSITRTSCQRADDCSDVTSAPTEAASLNAGITTEVAVVFALAISRWSDASCRVAEVDDVPVLNDVFLPFEAHFSVVAAGCHRAARDQGVVAHHFRADEAARDVAVDFTGSELR